MSSPQLPKPQTQHAAQKSGGGFFCIAEEDDFEPDSPECILTDKLIQGMMLGKARMAASALCELKELNGEALKSLALFFEESQVIDRFFPYRLEFRCTQRGKPKYQLGGDCSTPEKKLIDALMRRDRAAAGAVLRDKKQLRGEAVELLAELLVCPSQSSFPIRLVFRQRRRGREYHPLVSGAIGFARRYAFASAEAEIVRSGQKSKTEAAVADVIEKTGNSRATVFRALGHHRRRAH